MEACSCWLSFWHVWVFSGPPVFGSNNGLKVIEYHNMMPRFLQRRHWALSGNFPNKYQPHVATLSSRILQKYPKISVTIMEKSLSSRASLVLVLSCACTERSDSALAISSWDGTKIWSQTDAPKRSGLVNGSSKENKKVDR